MNQEFLVLQAKRYDFKGRDGDQLKGCTVHYIDPKDNRSDTDSIGYVVAKQNLPIERFSDFDKGPGIYKVSFRAVLQGKGMAMVPDQFSFLRPIEFTEPVKIIK